MFASKSNKRQMNRFLFYVITTTMGDRTVHCDGSFAGAGGNKKIPSFFQKFFDLFP